MRQSHVLLQSYSVYYQKVKFIETMKIISIRDIIKWNKGTQTRDTLIQKGKNYLSYEMSVAPLREVPGLLWICMDKQV